MRLRSFRISNFRRLKDVRIDLDEATTIFVGSNNSGKTSATHIFQLFLRPKEPFSIHDFSSDCWRTFDAIGSQAAPAAEPLPTIGLDLWFDVAAADIHRIIPLLPSLDWRKVPVGVRLEYAPVDAEALLSRFIEAKAKAGRSARPKKDADAGYHPWPETLTGYLRKRLREEYRTSYYVLDWNQFDDDLKEKLGYTPQSLGDTKDPGSRIIKSLVQVDFLHAQRHLSDEEAKGRAEDLSRRLTRFYQRNLEQHEGDGAAIEALARSEAALDVHLSRVFASTLHSLNTLGYPGFAEPNLVIKSALNPESILPNHAIIHYSVRDPGGAAEPSAITLPDRYNGLGFKNLIYMVIELLDFHERWAREEEDRAPFHLVFIEEPEAHVHTQLQQVFIRKIHEILPKTEPMLPTQFVLTTHSPHILYESNFTPIRYFRRFTQPGGGFYSRVLDLSKFGESAGSSREFLLKYMRLTHCDLFFADDAILVEGPVERMLIPLMIEKVAPELKSRYISVLEVGGAFAHVFRRLIHFLGVTTLIITDLDSVAVPPVGGAAATSVSGAPAPGTRDGDGDGVGEDDREAVNAGKAAMCRVETPEAITSNQTLIQWIPRLRSISELLEACPESKAPPPTEGEPARVRVAYQTPQPVSWNEETAKLTGRTFEEAFAYENLAWCQDAARKKLGLRVVKEANSGALADVAHDVYARVGSGSLKKTEFALALMMEDGQWVVPQYIAEGLTWLKDVCTPTSAAAAETEVEQ